MPELRLLDSGTETRNQGGEVYGCSFTPDGEFVLSAGWDGFLRLWEVNSGLQMTALCAGKKPLSTCAVSPEGNQWLSGSLDGLLINWDAVTQRQLSIFLAHTRPLSCILFSVDGQTLVTASWDQNITLWTRTAERDGRTLTGHGDIVSGCGFIPDGSRLVSWSYDGTIRLWEVARARHLATLTGHNDRITAGAVAPDGRWLATGARDGTLKLWDLEHEREGCSLQIGAEIRACFFLLDAASLLTADAHGHIGVYSVPDLKKHAELATRLPVQCAQLSPNGNIIALGCADGRVRLVRLDGLDNDPLVITPTRTTKLTSTGLQRLFGRSKVTPAYACTCPACHQSFELPQAVPGQPAVCPFCQRHLRLSSLTRVISTTDRSRDTQITGRPAVS